MTISGFTIVRNAVKYNYPVLESIRSILPVCDEFVVNLGDSDDETLDLIQSLNDPRIRIIHSEWDFSQGKEVLSRETNRALAECKGDWAFYLQSDEVIHEHDLPRLKKLMERFLDDSRVEALRFKWLHFYGSYFRYRVDHGWFQKQDRIIRNNGQLRSMGDAWGFERVDGKEIRRINTGVLLYHYGWVQNEETMAMRRRNAGEIGFVELSDEEREGRFEFTDLDRFPPYFGGHPAVMKPWIERHHLSREDRKVISRKFWWHPMKVLKQRYKTGRRVKVRIS